MSEIRAFVGHSFTDDDSAVVAIFLKYFDQISRSHQGFSWDHAESAEPKLLAEKVMSLINNNNVFIGICTRKEYVIEPKYIKTPMFHHDRAMAPKASFYWKTSDWIIQEIGLAIGKGLDIILLVENGLRKPGGLQGDVEYISFDRASPEKSFGKILDMITALSPRSLGKSAATGDMKSESDEEPRTPLACDESGNWWIPKPAWAQQNYRAAYMMATDLREADAQLISDAYLATDEAGQGDNRNWWVAFCEFVRLRFGKGGSIQRLKDLAAAHPHSTGVLAYLARAYEMYEDYVASARTYEVAAKEAAEDSERLRFLKHAAVAHAHARAPSPALAVIAQMKTHFQTYGTGEVELLNALRALAEIDKDDETVVSVMERILDIDSSDTDTRLSLAYKYSDVDNNALALFHYLRIPAEERTSMAWNNLGVTFDRSELPAKSIKAYRRAEQMDETLAMSNIAEKLITAGFLPEAQEECDKGLGTKNYHPNIVTTLARLKRFLEMEHAKQENILQTIRPVSEFYVKVGRAMCRAESSEIAKSWKGPECILSVTVHGAEFLATGSYEQRNLMASAFSGAGTVSLPEHYEIEYRGALLGGGVIKARVTRTIRGETPGVISSLGSRDNESIVLMIITDDQSEIQIMETTKGANPRFYAFFREPPKGN